MPDRTVWLVGLMGAGKSEVGRLLAERLGCPFLDADAEISASAGRSIAEIFASEGEAGFRRRESEAIEALTGRAAVVALGGGAMAQPGMAERINASGRSVYLKATAETLAARVGEGAERPLLAGLDEAGRLGRLRELLAARETCYEAAELEVETDGLALGEVAEAVLAALGEEAA
jgi:shikimate kinase